MKIVRLRYTWVLREKRPGGVGGGGGHAVAVRMKKLILKKLLSQ